MSTNIPHVTWFDDMAIGDVKVADGSPIGEVLRAAKVSASLHGREYARTIENGTVVFSRVEPTEMGVIRWPFMYMRPDEYLTLHDVNCVTAAITAHTFGKQKGWKFKTRTVEENTLRVWRTE